jgi:hypothetical protein
MRWVTLSGRQHVAGGTADIDFKRQVLSNWAKRQPFRDPRDLRHFVDGYLKAGLPE